MLIDKEKIYREALELWGREAQLQMVIEEAAETIQALCKVKRYNSLFEHVCLAAEIADLEIVLEQAKIILECESQVNDFKELALENLEKKIREAKHANRNEMQ